MRRQNSEHCSNKLKLVANIQALFVLFVQIYSDRQGKDISIDSSLFAED